MSGSPADNRYMLSEREEAAHRYLLLDRFLRGSTQLGLAKLEVPTTASVLDLGCGIGEAACYFAKENFPNGRVTGLDAVQVFIALAARKAAEEAIQNVSFVCSDAATFEYGTNQYDLVYARLTLRHIADRKQVLQKVFKGLKPGGVIFIEESEPLRGKQRSDWPLVQVHAWGFQLVSAGGGSPNFALEELPEQLKDLGYVDITTCRQTVPCDTPEYLESSRLFLQEGEQRILEQGIASRAQIDEISELLEQASPDSISPEFAMRQVTARKPNAPD
ncbi:hypothetical protein GCM10007094_40380 [Pseudovibrio japonicus]|uniref:Methyltransferase domain-containing protein n=2 Tax=Pseudovibrio japonicus TaxID=366534 RepID=A0ABQ3ERX2_9HYPH|nr:hypothetical protein GCM10007094_40380 [Pseudovibrio japonicus]